MNKLIFVFIKRYVRWLFFFMKILAHLDRIYYEILERKS
jgi:hypothetical protein